MKINKIVAFACLLSSASFAQTLPGAIKNIDNEQFTLADQELKKMAKLDPANGSLYFYMGENFFAQNKIDSAVYNWNKAFEKDPATALSIVSAGKAQWVKGDLTGAKEKFTKALSMTKNKNSEIMRQIAKVYFTTENKNVDEAITLLTTAIKIDSKNDEGYILMGDAILAKDYQNGNDAIANYNKALDANPQNVKSLVRIGKLYQRNKSPEEANKKYKEAQGIDPTFAPAYRENAELNLNYNQSAQAIENWKKYLAINNSDEARYRYVMALYQGKLYCDVLPEVIGLQQKGMNDFYLDRILMVSQGECTKDSVSAVKALQASEIFFKNVPADKILESDYKHRASLYLTLGKDSLAILEYDKASAMSEEIRTELSGTIAKLYMKAKKYDKVIQYYEYKLSKVELSPSEEFELGRAYYVGAKNYVLADSSFTRLVNNTVNYAPGYLWKARAEFQIDPKNEQWLAQASYAKVIEIVKPEERSASSNKSMVMESAKYMGNYYTNSPAKDIVKAKEYWTIVKDLDPENADAKAFFAKNK